MDYKIGGRYGFLTLLECPRRDKNRLWALFRCDCGTLKVCRADNVLAGRTVSCGCFKRCKIVDGKVQSGNYKHGDSDIRLHLTWQNMRKRCRNPKSTFYKDYGGRGISVCQEWDGSYETFKLWAESTGYAADLVIDRIDVNGDYAPENCRWVDINTSARNRRDSVLLTCFEETKHVMEWAEDHRCRVRWETLKARLARGWSAERAITAKALNRGPKTR